MFAASRRTPNIIYALWFQGIEEAPEIVRFNLDRWRTLNPTYELRILDAGDVQRILDGCGLAIESLSMQALSDIVRLRLLKEGGGIWTDASVLPLVPLDEWLPQALGRIGFFAFEREDVPLSSWFLCAQPGSRVAERWWQEAERLWKAPHVVAKEPVFPPDALRQVSPEGASAHSELPYFWVHYLFQWMLETDPEIAGLWARRRRLASARCHTLQYLFASNPAPSDLEIGGAAFCAPVQKLAWRSNYPIGRFKGLLTERQAVKLSLYRRVRRSLHPLRARYADWRSRS